MLVQFDIVVAMHEVHHDDPFCDLRTVDPRSGGQRDVRVRIDWRCYDMIGSSAEELDELQVRS